MTLEVIKFRDIVAVQEITRIIPGIQPTTIEIKGEDFRNVEEVYINDVKVPEFIVLNRNTMYVQLPPNTSTVKTISVVNSTFTKTAEASTVSYKIGDRPKDITGVLKLVQLFIAWMLKDPGSDVFNPDDGGGMQRVAAEIGTTFRSEPLLAAAVSCVRRAEDQIRWSQLNIRNLPLDEKLMSASIVGINMDEHSGAARIRIRIKSMAGTDAVSDLNL